MGKIEIESFVEKIFHEVYGVDTKALNYDKNLSEKVRTAVSKLRNLHRSSDDFMANSNAANDLPYSDPECRKAYMVAYYPYHVEPIYCVVKEHVAPTLSAEFSPGVDPVRYLVLKCFASGPCPEVLGVIRALNECGIRNFCVNIYDYEKGWFEQSKVTYSMCQEEGNSFNKWLFVSNYDMCTATSKMSCKGEEKYSATDIFVVQNYLSHADGDENFWCRITMLADVVNPFNLKQVSRISLSPKVVDCIVFWTKDAAPIIDRLDELKDYKFYFRFTITPYDEDVEPGLLRNQRKNDIIRTFQRLSKKIGKDKVVWRYDPILLSRTHSIDWHFEQFTYFCNNLAPYTNRCVISFLDLYSKTKHNTQPLGIRDISVGEMRDLALGISQIADGKLEVQSCSEKIDLEGFGIKHGACIDKEIIEQVIGAEIDIAKDKNQRQECGCMTSVDIGQYDTCTHFCAYCYANFRSQIAKANYERHDSKATSLFGEIRNGTKITERKMTPLKILKQQSLF